MIVREEPILCVGKCKSIVPIGYRKCTDPPTLRLFSLIIYSVRHIVCQDVLRPLHNRNAVESYVNFVLDFFKGFKNSRSDMCTKTKG